MLNISACEYGSIFFFTYIPIFLPVEQDYEVRNTLKYFLKSGKLYMWPKLDNLKVTLATPKNTTSCWNFLFIFWYHVEYCLNFMYGEFQVEILSGQSYLNFQKFELTLATFLLSSISPRGEC